MNSIVTGVLFASALVIGASVLFGTIARRLGQPAVVGQIFAGIAFGPTLLGHIPGHLMTWLFPQPVLTCIAVLAQVAVVIFMFSVGYEVNWPSPNGKARKPLPIALSALFVPMLLGAGITVLDRPGFTMIGQPHLTRPFILFMAVAMAITALPVLAALLRERGIADTIPGATAVAAAGLMDAGAWLALSVALAGTAGAHTRPWLVTFGLFGAFAAAMLLLVRRGLQLWSDRYHPSLSGMLALALALALCSAGITASLGVQPVFGGFIAGLAMPRVNGVPDTDVLRRAEDIGGLLLPLFFVVTGLSTNVGAMSGGSFVLLVVLCIVAAAGKLVPAYTAARFSGLTSHNASIVAVLINTRGLTELIVLNAGLDAGIIGRRLFSVLVLMALMLTISTAPLLRALRAPAAWARMVPGTPAKCEACLQDDRRTAAVPDGFPSDDHQLDLAGASRASRMDPSSAAGAVRAEP
jgi:Kef-type K+ transport system membrane component KefB